MSFPSPVSGTKGFSLIELLVAVAVMLIIAVIALPSFKDSIERQRIIGASESFYADMQRARSHALKINSDVFVNINVSASGAFADWCYGLTDIGSGVCDCATASAASCTLDGASYIVSGAQFPGVSLGATDNEIEFDSLRGTVTPIGGNVEFGNSSGDGVKVIYHFTGRVKRCQSAGSVGGLESCPP